MADIITSEIGDQIVMGVKIWQARFKDKGIIEHKKSFEECLETFYAEDKTTSKVLRLADLEYDKNIILGKVHHTSTQEKSIILIHIYYYALTINP